MAFCEFIPFNVWLHRSDIEKYYKRMRKYNAIAMVSKIAIEIWNRKRFINRNFLYIRSVSINVNTHHPSSEVIIAIIITCFNHSLVLLLYQFEFILFINSVNLYNNSKNRNFTRTSNVNLLYCIETYTQIAEQKSVFAFWLFWLRFLHHILSFFSLRCSFTFA